MNLQEYKELIRCGFIDNYNGRIKSYYSADVTPYKYQDVMDKYIIPQLTETYDLKNIIILIPDGQILCNERGKQFKDSFPITHASYPVDVQLLMKRECIDFKNGIKARDERFGQHAMSMVIIQDGIAYVQATDANPSGSNLAYHYRKQSEIMIQSEDLEFLNFSNKKIIFSGCLVKLIREGKI